MQRVLDMSGAAPPRADRASDNSDTRQQTSKSPSSPQSHRKPLYKQPFALRRYAHLNTFRSIPHPRKLVASPCPSSLPKQLEAMAGKHLSYLQGQGCSLQSFISKTWTEKELSLTLMLPQTDFQNIARTDKHAPDKLQELDC